MYLEVQRYVASLIQQASKDVNLQSMEATGVVSEDNKKAKNAQEAHEAIRPTDILKSPESIKKYLSIKLALL